MKKILAIGMIFVCTISMAQQVKTVVKEKPLTIKSVTPYTWYDSTYVTYTIQSGNATESVAGAGIGYWLLGPVGLIGGAIAGSSAEKTCTTHHRWDKTPIRGYKITVSDGYYFNTQDNSYKIGQPIKYK